MLLRQEALLRQQLEGIHRPLRAAGARIGTDAAVSDRDALKVDVEELAAYGHLELMERVLHHVVGVQDVDLSKDLPQVGSPDLDATSPECPGGPCRA